VGAHRPARSRMTRASLAIISFAVVALARPTIGAGQQTPAKVDSVMLSIVNTDLRSAVQMMQPYLDRPIIFSGQGVTQVSLETPRPIPRSDVVRMLRGLLESQGYDLLTDTTAGVYRARQ